jgi:hypothetical protein
MRPAGPISTGETTRWWLEWEQAGVRSRLPLDRPRWIGRDSSVDVRLRDATVSRRHAVVSVVAGQIVVDASTSTNGVQLDRARADRVALGPGQSFSIGGTVFRVVQASAAQPAALQPPLAPLPPGPARLASSRQTRPARTSNVPAIAIAIVAVAAVVVVAAIIGVLALHPFGGTASPEPASGSSSPGASGPTADGALPSGWKAMPSAAAGETVAGIDSGSVTFRTADGRVVAFSVPTPGASLPTSPTPTQASKVDGYSFNVLADWTVTRVKDGSHDLFHLWPAGFNPQDGSAKAPITVYWSKTAPQPDPGDETIADLGVGNVPVAGTHAFTVGGLSPLEVASMPCSGGYVVITGDGRDDAWIRAFMEVLHSWRAS